MANFAGVNYIINIYLTYFLLVIILYRESIVFPRWTILIKIIQS